MTNLESFTIGQLKGLAPISPRLALTGRQILANNAPYDEFVSVLYETIDACIKDIEKDPKIRKNDGEDRLTAELICMLCAAGFDADHDAMIGGHTDIVVKNLRGECWVGEAKIHGSYDYLAQGWNQLTTRYMRGTPGFDRGAFLVYIRNQDCSAVVSQWKSNLEGLQLKELQFSTCDVRQELGFYTEHIHQDSGRKVFVRHIGINLCWNPK